MKQKPLLINMLRVGNVSVGFGTVSVEELCTCVVAAEGRWKIHPQTGQEKFCEMISTLQFWSLMSPKEPPTEDWVHKHPQGRDGYRILKLEEIRSGKTGIPKRSVLSGCRDPWGKADDGEKSLPPSSQVTERALLWRFFKFTYFSYESEDVITKIPSFTSSLTGKDETNAKDILYRYKLSEHSAVLIVSSIDFFDLLNPKVKTLKYSLKY